MISALLLLAGCQRPTPLPPADPIAVDGERALAYTRELVAIRPRHSGSPGAAQAAAWLAAQAEQLGVASEIETWTEDTVNGPVTFRNVYARLPGQGDGYIIVGSHYDTKYLPRVPDFEGANDSGSSSGLLLEIIRALRAEGQWQGPDLLFVWFDGEECVRRYGPRDGLHGSRRLAVSLEDQGRFEDCRAMILLDMIGDRDLALTIPLDSDPELKKLVMAVAAEQGTGAHFGWFLRGSIIDDHRPFAERGVPAINLIDFEFGPGNSWWHTREDTMDKLSARSLETVGNAVVRMLQHL